jgi:hypothetical protein
MDDNTDMYKSKYKPTEGLPLTTTIPLLMEWIGESPYKIEEQSEGAIKQATLHRICTGETPSPKMPVITKIAAYFNLEFGDLYNIDKIRAYTDQEASEVQPVREHHAEYKSSQIRKDFIENYTSLNEEDMALVKDYVQFLLWKRSQR